MYILTQTVLQSLCGLLYSKLLVHVIIPEFKRFLGSIGIVQDYTLTGQFIRYTLLVPFAPELL